MREEFEKITKEMTDLCVKKNKDYGNSFNKSLDEDGLLVSKIRLGDKLARFSNLIKKEALVSDETLRDTLIDMASYAVLTIMWMDLKESATPSIVCGLDPRYMREGSVNNE